MKIQIEETELKKKAPDLGDVEKSKYRIHAWQERLRYLEALKGGKKTKIIDGKEVVTQDAPQSLFHATMGLTMGFGGIGDRYPITPTNEQAYEQLWWQFLDAHEHYGIDDDETQYLMGTLYQLTLGFMGRSTSRENDLGIQTVVAPSPWQQQTQNPYALPTENMPPPPPPTQAQLDSAKRNQKTE